MKITGRWAVSSLLAAALIAGLTIGNGCSREKHALPFTIAMSGYLMGQIDPCTCPGNPMGGLARRETMLKKYVPDRSSTLIVDAGNFLSLHRIEARQRTELTLAALTHMGVDAVNVAIRDMRVGIDTLREFQHEYQVPFVSANVLDASTGKPAFQPFRIVHLVNVNGGGSMDIGVIGLANGGSYRELPKQFGFHLTDPDKALNEALKRLKGRVDFVVLLTDADRGNTDTWLQSIEGDQKVNLVISCSVDANRASYVKLDGVRYTTSGRQGKFFDLLMLKPEKDGAWKIEKQGWPLKNSVPDDREMDAFLAKMRQKVGATDKE